MNDNRFVQHSVATPYVHIIGWTFPIGFVQKLIKFIVSAFQIGPVLQANLFSSNASGTHSYPFQRNVAQGRAIKATTILPRPLYYNNSNSTRSGRSNVKLDALFPRSGKRRLLKLDWFWWDWKKKTMEYGHLSIFTNPSEMGSCPENATDE